MIPSPSPAIYPRYMVRSFRWRRVRKLCPQVGTNLPRR